MRKIETLINKEIVDYIARHEGEIVRMGDAGFVFSFSKNCVTARWFVGDMNHPQEVSGRVKIGWRKINALQEKFYNAKLTLQLAIR
jgi:hypothetical protein